MLARKQVARGFTLVEILIVVVILGILAAIVIPQFTNASETARASSLSAQLQTIRSQLELYQVQHIGNYPAANVDNGSGAAWSALTTETEISGVAGDNPDVLNNNLGPYLQQPPLNAFEATSTVSAGPSAQGLGWVYDATDGSILAVMLGTKATSLNMDPINDIAPY